MPYVSGDYSPLAHLGRVLFGCAHSREKIFCMLTSYLDESQSPAPDVTVIAGWASTVGRWENFEIDWKLHLIYYDVPYLHMKELAHFNGPYKKWKHKESLRRGFLKDSAQIITNYVQHGFIFWMRDSVLQTVDRLFEITPYLSSPYALAGRWCMQVVRDWQKKSNFEVCEMRYVFDDDGPDKGGLMTAMTAFTPFFSVPSFESDCDVDPSPQWPNGRRGLVQLQAADFLAYEARKAVWERIRANRHVNRLSLGALLQAAPIQLASIREKQLARFCSAEGVKKRLPPDSAIYDKFKPYDANKKGETPQ